MKGRLDRVIAACGLISRKEAQAALKSGRVTLDGAVCRDGARKVDSDGQEIRLEGRRIEGDGFIYLMAYKPVGVLSATEDRRGAATVMDLLPEEYQKSGPGVVGRLDKDAEGLLLLTNNGELNHRLTAPRYHALKRYQVTLDQPADQDDQRAFAQPMDLGDFLTQPAGLEFLEDRRVCIVTLAEGKFHQIKRMFAHQGKQVERLLRLSIGPLELDRKLCPGEWRPLTADEIQRILQTVNLS